MNAGRAGFNCIYLQRYAWRKKKKKKENARVRKWKFVPERKVRDERRLRIFIDGSAINNKQAFIATSMIDSRKG